MEHEAELQPLRFEIARLRAALQTIADWCPASQEITLAHQMAEVAEEALNQQEKP